MDIHALKFTEKFIFCAYAGSLLLWAMLCSVPAVCACYKPNPITPLS